MSTDLFESELVFIFGTVDLVAVIVEIAVVVMPVCVSAELMGTISVEAVVATTGKFFSAGAVVKFEKLFQHPL